VIEQVEEPRAEKDIKLQLKMMEIDKLHILGLLKKTLCEQENESVRDCHALALELNVLAGEINRGKSK